MRSTGLSRLLRPKSVAVVGGGAWCRAVVQQLVKSGFAGHIWPVHPRGGIIEGRAAFCNLSALPQAPDAAFVGVNRDATIRIVSDLSKTGGGGAVCFASGFAEVPDGADRNAELLAAAGAMPILGPNCYGFINALDGALLWPDQHGCSSVASGVAILTQSSNIAINLTMQNRALPLAYVVTCGNQAQTSQAEIAEALLDDPRVTVVGLHIEGFGDVAAWQRFARKARDKRVPVVAIKVGRSDHAQIGAVSHTASLAGDDAASAALLSRLGIRRVDALDVLLETLKLLHVTGPLPHGGRIATISCSGGEASLAADLALRHGLTFPPLTGRQTAALAQTLGPKVSLANPLDYHTYIWRNTAAMTEVFAAVSDADLSMTLLIVDFPRTDICDATDWACAIDAAKGARARHGRPLAMVATLPELMPEDVARELLAHGIVPFSGLDMALAAVAAAGQVSLTDLDRDLARGMPFAGRIYAEADAKAALAQHGVMIPKGTRDLAAAAGLTAPLVLKGEGFAHKSEHGAVRLNLTHADLPGAAAAMNAPGYLIEEMVQDAVAELLIGVTLDPVCGYLLTFGAGGILAELLDDQQHLLLPTTRQSIADALHKLKVAALLRGYRGKPGANMDAIVRAVLAIQDFVLANAPDLQEVEINPLICTAGSAIAADALLRMNHD